MAISCIRDGTQKQKQHTQGERTTEIALVSEPIKRKISPTSQSHWSPVYGDIAPRKLGADEKNLYEDL